MSNQTIPGFASADLQSAVQDARSALEGVDEARNRVSSDVKALEAYLQSLKLTESFRYPLGKAFGDSPVSNQAIAASLEYSGSASGTIEEEALMWAADPSGNFRLMFEVTRWDGEIDVDLPGGPLFWDQSTAVRESKPLIETKFDVRKRMYAHLPDFVRAVSAHFTIEQPRKPNER